MANINQNPQHVARLGYSGFNMSNLLKFSSTTGELLPVYYDILQPGDKVNLKSTIRTRTMPLASPAMTSLTEHVDWFFVPIEQLYSAFGAFYYGVQDIRSSLMTTDIAKKLPTIEIEDIFQLCQTLYQNAGRRFPDNFEDVFGLKVSALRLADCLGFPLSRWLSKAREAADITQGGNLYSLGLTPLLLCAYQKIYMDYYRLSDREANDPAYYNLDKWYDRGSVRSFDMMFKMRYRPYKKDFFTNIQISPIFGEQNSVSIAQNFNPTAVRQWLEPTIAQGNPNGSMYGTTVDSHSNSEATTVHSSKWTQSVPNVGSLSYISAAQMRTTFAIDKLLEITRRAGKHYDKQTLAHFGVDVPDGISGECTYIGSSHSKINIGDVIATAETAEAPLGQLAGKGYGFGESDNMQYEAKCHGVLMAIYSCVPDVDYTNNMVDKLNSLAYRQDWYIPEYENLGMQPLFGYQCDACDPLLPTSARVGWQYRYSELKQKYNVVRGALADSLHYWSTQRTMKGNKLKDFLVSPWFLDDIMLVGYTPSDNIAIDTIASEDHLVHLYDRDPLVHEMYFDVKKASKMSTYGLPNL